MLEQDFEKLLAAYFEEDLDEAGLVMLSQGVQQIPGYRRRFQRELRLHTLMRESASLLVEEGGKAPADMSSIAGVFRRFSWQRLAAVAAVLVLCGLLMQTGWNRWGGPERVGRFLHVSDSNELSLWRDGKSSTVDKNTLLRAGDRIIIANQAQASLRVDGVGIITLQGQTELEIFPPNDNAAVSVKQGLVQVEADKREPGTPPLVFRTPKAEVEVMGTVFGLEVDATATRVRVHEGQVRYADRALERSVDVEAGQYCVNEGSTLEARDQADLLPGALMPGQIRLQAIADAYSERDRILNNSYLKVEYEKRVSYLKFEIPRGGEIVGAKLRITQMEDPGSGTLRFWEAGHGDWSEQSLTAEKAPRPGRQIAQHVGWVSLDQLIEVDVSSLIRSAGTYGLVITLDGPDSNDMWFGSRESPHPPELILTRRAE